MWIASLPRLEPTANAFFARIPPEVRAELEADIEYITLPAGKSLLAPGDTITSLLLPLTCLLGVTNVSDDGASTLLALVGPEGMLGLPAFLSGRAAAASAVVCTTGVAIRLPPAALQEPFRVHDGFRRHVLEYMQAFVAEMVATAHCGRHHSTLQQLSTLILRVQDKQGASDLLLTHERFASMLGVRRETVSHAAHLLQVSGTVGYRRGHVHVVDREGLERAACDCYRNIARVYRQIYSEDAAGATHGSDKTET